MPEAGSDRLPKEKRWRRAFSAKNGRGDVVDYVDLLCFLHPQDFEIGYIRTLDWRIFFADRIQGEMGLGISN
jgi:hypothetical protein